GSVLIMHTGVKDPCWFQSGNVGGVDLVDILVTHVAGIIAVVSPVQVFLLVLLCCAPGYGNAYREQRNCQHPNQCTAIPATYSGAHFSPSKAHSRHRFPRTLSRGRSSRVESRSRREETKDPLRLQAQVVASA